MAIQHLATFTWQEGTTPGDVLRIKQALRDFGAQLPGIESYDVGSDLRLSPTNAALGIAARFIDTAAFLAYRDHPRHRQINAELVAPLLAAKSAVQFETTDGP